MFTHHFDQQYPYCAHLTAIRQEDDSNSWTFAQLNEWVARVQHQLSQALPHYPVTVGLCMWNQVEWVVSLLALWRLGHVVVPLNPTLTPQELTPIAANAQLTLLITDDRPMQGPMARWQNGVLTLPAKVSLQSTDSQCTPLPDDLALLIYTSGTTGQPKGVMLTHQNIWADVAANIQVIQATDRDRYISLSPFFHVFGLINVLLTSLAVGAQLTLMRRFHPGRVLHQLQQGQITVLTGVPTMYQQLLRHWPVENNAIVSPRVCHSGAAPMPIPLFNRIEQLFHAPVQEGYGLSEASSIVTSNPLTGVRHPGSIGVAIPGVTTSVRDNAGNPVTQPDQPGELWVSGPTVMPGYWRQSHTDRLIHENGVIWLKTGDMMTQADDGYLRFLGRADDQMNIGGLKCYPVEIETALLTHPNVREAAVYVDATGQLQAQIITTDEAVTDPQLRRFLLDRLTPYKVPKQFTHVDQLPKGTTGKLLRRHLLTDTISKN